MTKSNRLLQGLKWVFIEQSGSQIISFLVFLLLARILGPEAFGILAISQIFVMFITQTIQKSFSQAIVQRESLTDSHLHTAFWANVILSLLGALTILLLVATIANFFSEPALIPVMPALALIFLFTPTLSIQQGKLRRDMNFKPLALQNLKGVLLGNIVAVVLALLGFGVWSLIAREVVKQAANTLLLFKVCAWRPRFQFSKAALDDIWAYSISVIKGNIVLFVSLKADSFAIGALLGSATLGLYHVAMRLVSTLNELLSRTIEKVAMPAFSKLQGQGDRLKPSFLSSLELTSVLIFPVFVGLILVVRELVPLIFGDKWVSAIGVMEILLLLGILQSLALLSISLLMGIGQAEARFRILAIESILKVVLILIFARYGIVATAWAVVAGSALTFPLWLLALDKHAAISPLHYLRSITPALVAVIAMILSIVLLESSIESISHWGLLARLAAKVSVAALVYILVISAFATRIRKALTHIQSLA